MKNTSTKTIIKNTVHKASDFPFPIERTASGSLYARMPTGELRRLDRLVEKGERKAG